MKPDERESIIQDEVIILKNSGEIPEITLHSSLHFLEEDEEGPGLSLHEKELDILYEAALERAREIVLRDLIPENRDKNIYRGVSRSIVNWHRLQDFCSRINRECPGFEETVFESLISFLHREVEDVETSGRNSSVNCSAGDILTFVRVLNGDEKSLPAGWKFLCTNQERG